MTSPPPGRDAPRARGVASDAAGVARAAGSASSLAVLDAAVTTCRACPRLVSWRESVAAAPRASYAGQTYWGRGVAGFGPADAAIVVLGLAPGAHGANRTGRVFTGDRSGDFLFAGLYRAGLANQPTSTAADDGLVLRGVRVLAAVRCAPPGNAPTPAERDTCAPFLDAELGLLPARVWVALGGFAFAAALGSLARRGLTLPRPRPVFAHGSVATVGDRTLVGCYHPSQQNTFTGRLTPGMLDDVLATAVRLAGARAAPSPHAAPKVRP